MGVRKNQTGKEGRAKTDVDKTKNPGGGEIRGKYRGKMSDVRNGRKGAVCDGAIHEPKGTAIHMEPAVDPPDIMVAGGSP